MTDLAIRNILKAGLHSVYIPHFKTVAVTACDTAWIPFNARVLTDWCCSRVLQCMEVLSFTAKPRCRGRLSLPSASPGSVTQQICLLYTNTTALVLDLYRTMQKEEGDKSITAGN